MKIGELLKLSSKERGNKKGHKILAPQAGENL
jgi:hypothetical protein